MTMAACYANYDMSLSQGVPQHQQHHQVHHVPVSMHQQGRMSGAVSAAPNVTPQKDYSTPLHVDCSVEYELPNQPKPPAGQRVEPLLMIHPCYFRKMESQRRSPFVNNMPNSSRSNMNALNCAAEVTLSNLRWDLPDRSPMATVPSNYQAGPDSTPTIMRDDKHTLSEKYRRQYLRSHRLHPYMMTAGAVGSTFPQLTATAFPQMQQVSCFNV
ncbi:unnamed protein product [Hermetia illucens]|uniref:Centrosomal and chromosomal factor n=1 Tax=Hermetia illucens TaxID=343691 RepID=A0A7R8V7T0_HERIL|nr:unnamed protein product [Hermetia illucens]